jgi:uncharacterized protein YegP (UPF0339 family)
MKMASLQRVIVLLVSVVLIGSVSLYSASAQTKDKKDAAAKDKKDSAKDSAKADSAAVFEIYKDKGGKFRFRYKNGEGVEVAMTAKGYESKDELQKIIDDIKKDAGKAKVVEEAKK